MKRLILLPAILIALSLPGFAQDASLALNKSNHRAHAVQQKTPTFEVVGRVVSITLSDPAKGVRPEIVVADETGKLHTLLVSPTTTVYGPDWKAIPFDKLVKDQLVRVQYTKNKEGFLIALSIKPAIKP